MRRTTLRYQRGESNVGCIIWGVLFAIAIFASYKMIPVKMDSMELQGHLEELAERAGADNRGNVVTPQKLRKGIMTKIEELDLPVDPEDVEVTKDAKRVVLKVSYTVPIEFPGYTYDWDFEHEVDRNIYLF
ncbi:MAG: hypothetical protein AAGD01_02425 [Acidobacteriota bacterium]